MVDWGVDVFAGYLPRAFCSLAIKMGGRI